MGSIKSKEHNPGYSPFRGQSNLGQFNRLASLFDVTSLIAKLQSKMASWPAAGFTDTELR
jgi:hypothetical protein